MYLALDIGNTRSKAAVYDGTTRMTRRLCPTDEALRHFVVQASKAYPLTRCAVALTGLLTPGRKTLLDYMPVPVLQVNGLTNVPLHVSYTTPSTLGADRLAAAVGAHARFPEYDLLVVDAGTCITYDYVTAGGDYQGGNISPGVSMRLAAMHEHTARLPLVKDGRSGRIGHTTEEALRFGARFGARMELHGYLEEWLGRRGRKKHFAVITGGENLMGHLSTSLRSRVEICPDLVMDGLAAILTYQDSKRHP